MTKQAGGFNETAMAHDGAGFRANDIGNEAQHLGRDGQHRARGGEPQDGVAGSHSIDHANGKGGNRQKSGSKKIKN